jgi:hypothetical protein
MQNTDRHLWPDVTAPGAPDESIHVTATGGIGINVGGLVIVKPLREWHRLALLPVSRTWTDVVELLTRTEEAQRMALGLKGDLQMQCIAFQGERVALGSDQEWLRHSQQWKQLDELQGGKSLL